MRNYPVDTANDSRSSTASCATENAHWNKRHCFCNAIRGTTNSARNVRAVTVTIARAVRVGNCGEARANTTTEIAVSGQDARVDDVGRDTGTGLVIGIARVAKHIALIDSVKPPRRIELIALQHHQRVLFDCNYICVFLQAQQLVVGQLGNKPIERVAEHRQNLRPTCFLLGRKNACNYIAAKRDDVLPSDWHTCQVLQVGANIGIFGLRALSNNVVIDGQHLIAFDDKHIFVFAQSCDIVGIQFGHEPVDSRCEHVADGITHARFFGNFARHVGAVFQ